MTRPVHGDFLKDDSSSVISDHLRNHVHLTNCIHLKNHMHRHSPILAERSLMRDLIVLQRSRSLRDPSTSPPSWQTPSVAGSLARKLQRDGVPYGGRRSLGVELQRDSTQLSATLPWLPSVPKNKIAAAEVSSDHNSKGRAGPAAMSGKEGEETSRRSAKSNLPSGSENVRANLVSGKMQPNYSQKIRRGHNNPLKTLSEQLEEHPNLTDAENAKIHKNFHLRRHEEIHEDSQARNHGPCNGFGRVKRRKFKGVRKARGPVDSIDTGVHNDLSVASNTLAHGSMHHNYSLGREEDDDAEVTRAPRNGCGIPWNWSRIHHRGKTFLDMAGRSLSCGRSDSRLRKDQHSIPQNQWDNSDTQVAVDCSSSYTKSDSDTFPLLNEPYGSQESAGDRLLDHDFSGELGIYASHNEQDSDLASEARSGNDNPRGYRTGRHQSLTQKYMPKMFKDLVGQNLVVQALSNAVVRKRVGLVYVFYGPQGTGKTSCARIFARALNCLSLEQTKPCGTCTSCISYNLGKSRNVLEVGPVGNFNFESIVDVFENSMLPLLSSQYRVFIVDDCDTLPPDSWNSISKVIDRAPRRVVFLLISTCLDHLPHIITSRCQKFFFPKLKDADVIYTLQWIASKEGLDIDKDALKLIASRSDGSLRDAEMTLDQLSLLGQTISVTLVQELVGLVSDEKLVDLLDLALSADTVNTVKRLREIMEAGVEPLALMSQLATIITDILAGSYVFTREGVRRRFFRRLTLSKEDMEKLRQALKTLSEAEKQLRMSNDKLTWLTAALLQLAPDQQYMLTNSSADASYNHSPMLLNYNAERETLRNDTSKQDNMLSSQRGLSGVTGTESHYARSSDNGFHRSKVNGTVTRGTKNSSVLSAEVNSANGDQNLKKGYMDVEKIWMAVIDKIQINALKQFMYQEGKLMSLSFGAAPTVHLMFSSHANKSKAEKFRGHMLQAFESVLCTAVTLEIRCGSWKDMRSDVQIPHDLATRGNGSSRIIRKQESYSNDGEDREGLENHVRRLSNDNIVKGTGPAPAKQVHSNSHGKAKSEIIELLASPHEQNKFQWACATQLGENVLEHGWEEASCSHHQAPLDPISERRDNGDQPRRQSLVRGKVSLARVIQQAEGCAQQSGWSKRKAISIAEKLEQENLRLEPSSRSLLCWKASRITRRKLIHLRTRTRRPHTLLKLISCGRCSCAKTPK